MSCYSIYSLLNFFSGFLAQRKTIGQLRFFVFIKPIFLFVDSPSFEEFNYFFIVNILFTASSLYIPTIVDSNPKS